MRRLLLKSAAFLLIFALSAGLLGAGKASASVTPMVAGGWDHSLALKSDGTVWAWGRNGYGQLGDGTTIDRYTPVQVQGLTGVVAVAAGYNHSLALKSDGTVWAWGINYYGQLGDGTTTDRATPVQVKGPGGSGYLMGVVAVAAGSGHSLALKSDGTVWAWGWNSEGQLGDGTTTNRTTPVQVLGPGGSGYLTGVVAVAAGGGHSLALKSDGTVWAWGRNGSGQLGDGTTTKRYTPVQVKGPGGSGYLTGVVAVAAWGYHSLALKSDRTVWGWGYNEFGQLGDGTTTNRTTPVQVGSLTDVVAVSAGDIYSLAVKSDGTVWAWGGNFQGQLGDGTTTDRTTPVQVKGPGGSGYLTDVVGVAAGSYHSLALKTHGTVWAWGANNYGQLGDGMTTDRDVPVMVSFPSVPAVQSLAVQPDSVMLLVGETRQLEVTAVYSDGTTGDVTGSAAYASSNSSIAAVSGSGLVTAAGPGTATITVTYEGRTATVSVIVSTPVVIVENLTVQPNPVTLTVGGRQPFTVTAIKSDGSTQDVTDLASYEISDTSIAAVEGATVVGLAPGTGMLVVTYGEASARVPVVVSEPQGSEGGSGSGGGGSGATVVSPPPRPGAPPMGPRPASSPAVNCPAGRTVPDMSAIPVAAFSERSRQVGLVVSPPSRSGGGGYGVSPTERPAAGSIPVAFRQR